MKDKLIHTEVVQRNGEYLVSIYEDGSSVKEYNITNYDEIARCVSDYLKSETTYLVSITIIKTQHYDMTFEVKAGSQEEANKKVRDLGFSKSLDTFEVVDENIYAEEFNDEYFEVLGE